MKVMDIIEWIKGKEYEYEYYGDPLMQVEGFCSLDKAEPRNLIWIKSQEKYDKVSNKDKITLAVVQKGIHTEIQNQIIVQKSKEVYFSILHDFWGEKRQSGFVGQGTYISDEVAIGPSVYIGYNCTIVGDVAIGANTVIENNVVITGKVTIGDRCHIQSLTAIGIDGFGYSKNEKTGKKTMIEHFGGVVIGNDVFIGSHVNIAKGTIDDTVIEDGVKIAPSTHVGHNNHIGENATVICSNLFGSVSTGAEAYITASTVQNQTTIGQKALIGMGSVVNKDIPNNVIAFGVPARVIKDNDTNY